ncbi:MAG: hemerythrin domain-containing protein [Burkholderiales bacterium]|jgi:hemerythrin-like domain-containing protein|nr:hemerythrin domain-containing protein [Burkholderiales bacterium]
MTTISGFMTDDHRACDGLYAEAEAAVARDAWDDAAARCAAFARALERHFTWEEETLFPAFEARTGMTEGPTVMMRMEHAEMRDLAAAMQAAIEARAQDEFFGAGETLVVLMQQHNMKEEQILYPLIDRSLGGEADDFLARLASPA